MAVYASGECPVIGDLIRPLRNGNDSPVCVDDINSGSVLVGKEWADPRNLILLLRCDHSDIVHDPKRPLDVHQVKEIDPRLEYIRIRMSQMKESGRRWEKWLPYASGETPKAGDKVGPLGDHEDRALVVADVHDDFIMTSTGERIATRDLRLLFRKDGSTENDEKFWNNPDCDRPTVRVSRFDRFPGVEIWRFKPEKPTEKVFTGIGSAMNYESFLSTKCEAGSDMNELFQEACEAGVFPGYCLFKSRYFGEWIVAKTHSMDEAIANGPTIESALEEAIEYLRKRVAK